MRVWSWFIYKFTENYCRLRLSSDFIQTKKRYPTALDLKTTCHIKLKFFMWTKLLESLMLAKYFISVTVTLIIQTSFLVTSYKCYAKYFLICFCRIFPIENKMTLFQDPVNFYIKSNDLLRFHFILNTIM